MARKTIGLHTHIWNNNLLSLVMLLVLPLTLFLLTLTITVLWFSIMDKMIFIESVNHSFALVMANAHILFAVVSIWYTIAWLFNKQIILSATGAKSVSRKDEKRLYNLLENLAISRSLPMPQLAIIETSALNAFASGIDNASYTVTVTRGLMTILDDDELEAVLAHELTHIQNNDVRLMVIISIFAGMIGIIMTLVKNIFYSDSSHYHTGYGLSSHRSSSSNGRSSGQFMIFILAVVAVGFLASVITNFAKLYISRRREFMADAGAVKLTQNPAAMVRALRKIEGESAMPAFPAAVAEMCISPSAIFKEASSTHPTTDSRVEALKEIAGYGLSEEDYKIDKQALSAALDKARGVSSAPSHNIWDNQSATSPAMPMAASTPAPQAMTSVQNAPTMTRENLASDTLPAVSNPSPQKMNVSNAISQDVLQSRLGKSFGTRTAQECPTPESQSAKTKAALAKEIWKKSNQPIEPETYTEVYLKKPVSSTTPKQRKPWASGAKKQWGNMTQKFHANKAMERS